MLKVLDRAREDNVEAADEAGLTLDEVAREGARRMLAAALEAEVEHYIEAHARCARRGGPTAGRSQWPRAVTDGDLRSGHAAGPCSARVTGHPIIPTCGH